MIISDSIKYVGVNDYTIDLFEGQYDVPKGMSYNSYVIIDDKIAVMDSVDIRFSTEWIANIRGVIGDKMPDYLIIGHMEPDHSSSIMKFLSEFPDVMIVSTRKAFDMMMGFFGNDFADKRIIVNNGDILSLGRHKLSFITATMVHWPEVVMSYDPTDKVLFSADAFGKFSALDDEEEWTPEARRYYFGIIGKYGAQVSALLKKLETLDIGMICPLHGPVLDKDINYYIDCYRIWSSYLPESKGTCIAYTSIYQNTRAAVELLYSLLNERGVRAELFDLARCDIHKATEAAFRYDRLVLATTTYNADIFPYMKVFIDHLTERNYQNRTVGFIENGSWLPTATKVMKKMLEKSKDLTYLKTEVRIHSAQSEQSRAQIAALADELAQA